MATIPKQNLTLAAVEGVTIKEALRPYMGYSGLGHACPRYLWYQFRWCYTPEYSAKQKRLFSRGDQEEPIVVRDLEHAGIKCFDVLENQIELVGGIGHMKGHPDGRCINVPDAPKTEHSLEIKTANDKRFTEFKRFGIERSSPTYWVQTQCYMHKQNLSRVLYVVTNKNTDERIYERYEIIPEVAMEAEERGLDIIVSTIPPAKLSERAEWHECKWCDAHAVCHMSARPEKNCRTCCNSTILEDGKWGCKVYTDSPIPVDFQRKGCDEYYKPII